MASRVLLVAILLAAGACQRGGKSDDKASSSDAVVAPAVAVQPGLSLQRKRAHVVRDGLAKALTLHPIAMCMELGKLPCADLVHNVSLGGVAAYTNSQFKHSFDIGITAPSSFDRVVLSACIQRAQIDLSNTKIGVIYKDVSLTVDGRLVDDAAVDQSIDRLYQRGLTRMPTDAERSAIRQLYKDIYDEDPVGAARNWMALACYAVLSSTEAAFY